MRHMPMVRVEWDDACAITSAWTHLGDVESGPRKIVTLGFLLADDDDGLQIAQSIDGAAESVDNVIRIPAPMVRKVERLRRR